MIEKPPSEPARVVLGIVTGAHGIMGEVKVKTFTAAPDGLGAYGALSTDAGRTLRVTHLRSTKPGEAVVRFEDVSGRNEAEALKGAQLYVPRSALPLPEPGEFYLADLVGLRAEDDTGVALGAVKAVHNFGAGDVLEIAMANGASEFVPFAEDVTVDIGGGRIVVPMPRYDEGER